MAIDEQKPDFHSLTPEVILPLVEKALDKRLTPLCRPYTSYINRVYEMQLEEGGSVVAKFYRPGRWKREALQEEHDFLLELKKIELPIIAPEVLTDGKTLGEEDGMFFALFPKKGGRNCDELRDQDWLEIGRLLGRVHQVGAMRPATERVVWRPEEVTRKQVTFILEKDFIPKNHQKKYEQITNRFIQVAEPLFEKTELLRIHGDFHFANLILRPGESFYMIDFDDMAMGPSVQDLWMLLPGYRHEVQHQINLFIEGYETFRDFSFQELKLVEVLRAMRYIHFSAWCAYQVLDGGFSRLSPNWGTDAYWREEIQDLEKQMGRIESELNHFRSF